jgi:hypothetical protein
VLSIDRHLSVSMAPRAASKPFAHLTYIFILSFVFWCHKQIVASLTSRPTLPIPVIIDLPYRTTNGNDLNNVFFLKHDLLLCTAFHLTCLLLPQSMKARIARRTGLLSRSGACAQDILDWFLATSFQRLLILEYDGKMRITVSKPTSRHTVHSEQTWGQLRMFREFRGCKLPSSHSFVGRDIRSLSFPAFAVLAPFRLTVL